MHNSYTREELATSQEMQGRYDIEYPGYQPDQKAISHLKTLIKNKKITIVLGTWCGDSKLQLPRFYKVMDEAGAQDGQVTLICVDESKKAENGLIDHLNIDRIPVFIFTENDMEIGRITESPLSSLENDMVEILTKK
ncbi:thioredoxin family protein [Pedobacter sp. L105]|uniref:thioredoxin family protein n=1 Tax=Pedobacter sp. L105 TaxID=1641871 RepID=UPI00131DC10C|nr:thioredoxin family protein [Pedobacter sp. L105]